MERKERMAARRAACLCIDCGQPVHISPSNGRLYARCLKHVDAHSLRQRTYYRRHIEKMRKKRRQERKNAQITGRCIDCLNKITESADGSTRCRNCLELKQIRKG